MPSLCPVCGRMYCDHEPGERGQTVGEMTREPTDEEMEAWRSGSDSDKQEVARRHAHDPVRPSGEV